MSQNSTFVGQMMLQVPQIKVNAKPGNASFSAAETGPAFENVLDQKMQVAAQSETSQPQTQNTSTRSVEQSKETAPPQQDTRSAKPVAESERDQQRVDANRKDTAEKRETERPVRKTESEAENQETRVQAKKDDNQQVVRQAQIIRADMAVEKQLIDSQKIKEKTIKYTDSEGKERILKLPVKLKEDDKVAQDKTEIQDKTKRNRTDVRAEQVHVKTDVALNARQFDDDNKMIRIASQTQSDSKTHAQKLETVDSEQSGKISHVADLFKHAPRIQAAAEERKGQSPTAGAGMDMFASNRQMAEVVRMEKFTNRGLNQIQGHEQQQGISFERAMAQFKTTNEPQIRSAETRQQVMNQFMEAAKVQLSKDNQQMTVQLKPDYLGEINMTLQMKNDGVSGQTILTGVIEVENSAVKDVLTANLNQLKTQLQDQNGISVAKFDILVRSDMPNQQDPNQENKPGQFAKGKTLRFMKMNETEAVSHNAPLYGNAQDRLVVNGYSWTA